MKVEWESAYGIGYCTIGDKVACIDAEDIPTLEGHRLFITHQGYPATGRSLPIHRMIIGDRPGMVIDHMNRNGLDNRKCNLRHATRGENVMNGTGCSYRKSPHKGVYWEHKGWVARITHNGEYMYLGRYKNVEDAIEARETKEKELYGEFAYTEA